MRFGNKLLFERVKIRERGKSGVLGVEGVRFGCTPPPFPLEKFLAMSLSHHHSNSSLDSYSTNHSARMAKNVALAGLTTIQLQNLRNPTRFCSQTNLISHFKPFVRRLPSGLDFKKEQPPTGYDKQFRGTNDINYLKIIACIIKI
jgi:hypothetical protein